MFSLSFSLEEKQSGTLPNHRKIQIQLPWIANKKKALTWKEWTTEVRTQKQSLEIEE